MHAGELVLLTKKAKPTKIDKQAFYSQLLAVAAKKGYREGWISNQYRNYFGVWPRGLHQTPAEPDAEFLGYMKHLQIKFAKSRGASHADR